LIRWSLLIYSFAGVKLFPYHFGLNISQMYVCVWSNTRLADHLAVPHFIILTFNGTSLIVDLLLLSRGLLSPDHSTSESVLHLLHFQSYAVSIKTVKNKWWWFMLEMKCLCCEGCCSFSAGRWM